jgi:hypothetical protein
MKLGSVGQLGNRSSTLLSDIGSSYRGAYGNIVASVDHGHRTADPLPTSAPVNSDFAWNVQARNPRSTTYSRAHP